MYCTALDLQERDEYYRWASNPNINHKKSKFKWVLPDKGGTRSYNWLQIVDFKKLPQVLGNLPKVDRQIIVKNNTRPVLYIDKNRVLWDKNGELYLDLKGLPTSEITKRTRDYLVLPKGE